MRACLQIFPIVLVVILYLIHISAGFAQIRQAQKITSETPVAIEEIQSQFCYVVKSSLPRTQFLSINNSSEILAQGHRKSDPQRDEALIARNDGNVISISKATSAFESYAGGLNDRGYAVGNVTFLQKPTQLGYVWNGKGIDLINSSELNLVNINNPGQIISWGFSLTNNMFTQHIILISPQSDGGFNYLDLTPNLVVGAQVFNAYPYAINDQGMAIGIIYSSQDFTFLQAIKINTQLPDAQLEYLQPHPGATFGSGSFPYSINSNGEIVGEVRQSLEGQAHAAWWQGNALRLLGSFRQNGASTALDINNQSEIVGEAEVADPQTSIRAKHAFIFKQGRLNDLNRLLCTSLEPNYTLSRANSINDLGEIAAVSQGNTLDDWYGVYLVPVQRVKPVRACSIRHPEFC